MASPTRRTRDSSSILARMVLFACSTADARKAIRRSMSFGIGLLQKAFNLCSSLSQIGCYLKKGVLTETQGLKDFRGDFCAFICQRHLGAHIGRVHTRDDWLSKVFRQE